MPALLFIQCVTASLLLDFCKSISSSSKWEYFRRDSAVGIKKVRKKNTVSLGARGHRIILIKAGGHYVGIYHLSR